MTPETPQNDMFCSDAEILLAEYVEGTLSGATKAALEKHLLSCANCRELAQDASSAVAFLARTAVMEAPPELVNRILFRLPAMKASLARRLFGQMVGAWLEPILQPRLVMGMGAAVLSFFMLEPQMHQLTSGSLDPVKVYTAAENGVSRMWERGVKSYENIRVVYEIQTRLSEWQSEAPDNGNQPPQNSK